MGEVNGAQVTVNFWIENKSTKKTVADGHIVYTLISISSGRPVRIPEEVIERHSI
jgi:acyl-CoA thioesterase FadM